MCVCVCVCVFNGGGGCGGLSNFFHMPGSSEVISVVTKEKKCHLSVLIQS